jgi:hypothetical protein
VVGTDVVFTATVSAAAPGSGTPSGTVTFWQDGDLLAGPLTLVNGSVDTPIVSSLAVGEYLITATYESNVDYFNDSAAPSQLTQKMIEASIVAPVDPGDGDQTFTFDGEQGGEPVTTEIEVPAGAVDSQTVLVFREFTDSALTPPTNSHTLLSFTLEAFQDGELVPNFTFNEPLRITLTYYLNGMTPASIRVLGWNGATWSANGLVMDPAPARVPVLGSEPLQTISFFVIGTAPLEYGIFGSTVIPVYLPAILRPINASCQLISKFPSDGQDYRVLGDFDGKWVIQNNGDAWLTNEVVFKYLSGTRFQTKYDSTNLTADILKGERGTFIIDMRAPDVPGTYTSTWGLVWNGTTMCTYSLTIDVTN